MLPRNNRGLIQAWCLYDWANSAFTTLVVTFVYATYFTRAMASDEIAGTALWSRSVSLTALVVALSAPLLGALADRGGRRRLFLAIATVTCAVATAALAFIAPGTPNAVLIALILFTVANIGFELGNVFYFAFLPDLTTPDRVGRLSGYGWGLGYAGGLACLVVALIGFVQPETPWFGLSTEAGFNVRATNLLVAAWLLIFSVPLLVKARGETASGGGGLGETLAALGKSFREVRRYSQAARLLVARLLYNDGLSTVFAFGGIYAAGTFGLSFSEILVFGIVLNVAAGLGAWLFGFIDDRIGGKQTVLASIVMLSIATAIAAWAPTRAWLWTAGIMIGLFAGPNQSASRSLLARFAPDGRESEFFGFFAFSGKLASFAGPFLFGLVTQMAHTQRAGIATILFFFIAGGLIMVTVDEQRGIREASG